MQLRYVSILNGHALALFVERNVPTPDVRTTRVQEPFSRIRDMWLPRTDTCVGFRVRYQLIPDILMLWFQHIQFIDGLNHEIILHPPMDKLFCFSVTSYLSSAFDLSAVIQKEDFSGFTEWLQANARTLTVISLRPFYYTFFPIILL